MQRNHPAMLLSLLFVMLSGLIVSRNLPAQDSASTFPGGQTNFYTNTVQTALAPSGPLTDRIASEMHALDPRVGIEISISIPVTEETFTPRGMTELYNILRRVSTMEGIEYYSASRDEMRTFYHESYAVASADDQRRIADPEVTRIPAVDTIHIFQRDGSFGRNVQRVEYRLEDDAILLAMTNTTTMVYKVVPLVSPEQLRTFILVVPRQEAGIIEFYGNLGVRVPALFGMQDRARDSFYNRIVALHGWFAAQLVESGLAR